MRQTQSWDLGFASVVLCALSLAVMAYTLSFMGSGFDFTDEAYYVIWIKDPFYYDYSNTQFGFVYFPLFHFLGQDPHLLRVANIALTYGTGLVLSYATLGELNGRQHFAFLSLAQAMAISTLSIAFLFWLPLSPSYNTLTLQALMLTAIGVVRASKNMSRGSVAGWILIGVGGWLTFMAKVSTAAVLGPLVVLIVFLSGRWSLRGLAISTITSALLLVTSAYAIDGSLTAFLDRIRLAVEISGMAGAGYSLAEILRLDVIDLAAPDWIIAIATGAVLLLAGVLFRRPLAPVAGLAMALFCCLTTALILLRVVPSSWDIGLSARAILLVFPATSSVLTLSTLPRLTPAAVGGKISAALLRNSALGLGFMALPLVYAFGSNNNYWMLAGDACIFWVLAAVLFATGSGTVLRDRDLIPYTLLAPVLALFFLQHGLAKPYRQPEPLWTNNRQVALGNPSHSLTLSSDFAAYIEEAHSDAKAAGFQPGMPVIDLSGQSPGLLFALGARNVGYPWLSGGYPGSTEIVKAALERVDCRDLAQSWVLLERTGPRMVDSSVLSVFGADVDEDFNIVAQWTTAVGAGGYSEARVQELLRPTKNPDAAVAECSASRSTSPARN
ncbi:hypothetical protein [Devosia sp. LjRoot3]|uniref:hypothetical protein n=1 Tax=Devosia sp. LjRoot3 TaxID=3342319 RepID=UPI003ECDDAA1